MARVREIDHVTPLQPLSPGGSGVRPAGNVRPPDNRPDRAPHAPTPRPRAARTDPRPGVGRRRPTTARPASRRFLRAERGSVALESALALSVLVGGFSGLMHIVADVFAEDHAGRGARAAARAIAIDPSADPWAALKREGGLGANAVCPAWSATDTTATCGGWTLTVHRGVSPGTLGAVLGGGDADPGEMVLVRLERTPPSSGTPPQSGQSAGTPSNNPGGANSNSSGGAPKTVAIGLARSEPRG